MKSSGLYTRAVPKKVKLKIISTIYFVFALNTSLNIYILCNRWNCCGGRIWFSGLVSRVYRQSC